MPKNIESTPNKKLLTFLSIVFLLGAGFLINNLYQQEFKQKSDTKSEQQIVQKKQLENSTSNSVQEKPLPESFKLTVPFTPQAPTGKWDQLHDTACEEVSSIIVSAYFSNIEKLEPKYVDQQIDKLTKWEDDNFGYHEDTTTKEVAQMINKVYDLQTDTVKINEQTIKKALVENKLVIIPTNGQLLKNPHFQTPGPIYHMIVVTGYDQDGFIVNDPGTKRGLNYRYIYQTLYDSNGGWSHTLNKVDLTDKKIIIVSNN